VLPAEEDKQNVLFIEKDNKTPVLIEKLVGAKRTVEHVKVLHRGTFFGYNVWGFKDESWRKLIIPGDPNQPDKEAR
jgi:hypothetical protein